MFSVLIAQIFVRHAIRSNPGYRASHFPRLSDAGEGARLCPVANILLITVSVVPLVAVTRIELAYGLVFTLIAGSILAVLLVFLAYAFFPARDHGK